MMIGIEFYSQRLEYFSLEVRLPASGGNNALRAPASAVIFYLQYQPSSPLSK